MLPHLQKIGSWHSNYKQDTESKWTLTVALAALGGKSNSNPRGPSETGTLENQGMC